MGERRDIAAAGVLSRVAALAQAAGVQAETCQLQIGLPVSVAPRIQTCGLRVLDDRQLQDVTSAWPSIRARSARG